MPAQKTVRCGLHPQLISLNCGKGSSMVHELIQEAINLHFHSLKEVV